MPRLLHINTTLNWGSTGRIAEQIALSAQEEGWDCYIAHGGRYIGNSAIETIQISSKVDNYIHALMGELMGMHGLGSVLSTERFVKMIDRLRPDIIHLHNIHGYYLNYKILFEYLAKVKIPIVWTLHDCWSFTGHCTHFENVHCNKWKTECGQCPLLMAQYKSRIFDRSRNNYLLKKELYNHLKDVTIVPVSNWLGKLVSQSILGKFPIEVIHNGIDINMFKPMKSTIRERYNIGADKAILLGVVGSGFDNEKGKSEFVELSKLKDLQIILVGLSSDDAKGLPKNIIKIERTNNQRELAEFYSAADIFVNPTYNDTFPTTNIEALACGTPVVTYRTGGSPETIDENTGIVVDKGDFESLLGAIKEICNKGKGTYSRACRERALRFFNKDERFMDYIQLYDKILQNHV
jgi:glycosyltransferase involved in cell wall biosynthesis